MPTQGERDTAAAAADTVSPATALEGTPRKPVRHDELSRGTIVGRYVVLDRLGAGGMGVVYTAWDPELNRRVALKLVGRGADAAASARMLREAQALARLSHPNVVVIYDVGSIGERVFLAMELVDGVTMSAWLRASKRSWRDIVRAFAAAGRGLSAAHAAGVIHRDFKPGNVIVGDDGRTRVLDFGLARAAGDGPMPADASVSTASRDALGDELTVTGSVLGTPVYMPPEAYTGAPVHEAGDQFSFCVALYEALYAERPFDGPITATALPPVREAPADSKVPSWLRAVVLRGLAFDPAVRFATMTDLLAAVEADPAVRRRRILVAVAAVVAAGGLVLFGVQLRAGARVDDPCAVESPMAGTWDDQMKREVTSAFAKAGAADSQAQLARTSAALDDAAGAWLGARREACAATRERHAQPEAELLLRLACLDHQQEDLAALISLFARADAATVAVAPDAVHQLAGPAVCANARSLAFVEPPPPPLRSRAADLQRRLADVRAKMLAGKDLAAAFGAVVDDARRFGYGPLLAEALYLRGRHFIDRPEAIRDLDEAEYAATASRLDSLAARAAAERLAGAIPDTTNPELLRSWVDRARTWVGRTGDLEAEIDLEVGLARIASTGGDYADAVTHYQRGLDISARVFRGTNARLLQIQASLGFALLQMGRYDDVIAVLGKAVSDYERLYGNRAHVLALPLDNYGLALAVVGRYAEARPPLEHALEIARDDWVRGAVLCDLSRVELGEGANDRAVELGEHGLVLLRTVLAGYDLAVNEDPLAAAYAAVGRHAEALTLSRECLAGFAQAKNDGPDLVACLTIEGASLVDLGKPRDAVPELERALRLQAGHPPAPGALANVQFQLARALVASGGDLPRAHELAATARTELARYPFKKRELDQLDGWRRRR